MSTEFSKTRDSFSTRQPDAWGRWLWIFHVLAYLALAGSVLIAATHSEPRSISLTSVLVLSAFLGLWYVGVMLSKYEFWALYLPYSLLYFAAGWVAWIWLANSSQHFMMLDAMLCPATFIRLPMRWAAGTARRTRGGHAHIEGRRGELVRLRHRHRVASGDRARGLYQFHHLSKSGAARVDPPAAGYAR